MLSIVYQFHGVEITVTHILREINLETLKGLKLPFLAIVCSEFSWFGTKPLESVKSHKSQNSEALKGVKSQILHL